MVGYEFHYKNSDHREEEEEERSGRKGRRQPPWLQLLLRSQFFRACDRHRELRRCEMNIYCVDCSRSLCPHCLATPSSPHRPHRLLQIRRYVYQDVVRVRDIQKLLDCSKVQPYTVNSAKVVLLNPRRQSKPSKGIGGGGGGGMCEICGRTVTEPYRYCSIFCKASDEEAEAEAEEAVASSAEEGSSDCNRSRPFLPSLTRSALEGFSPSLSSPQPSDSGEENRGHWMGGPQSPTKKIARRKGYPRRASIF